MADLRRRKLENDNETTETGDESQLLIREGDIKKPELSTAESSDHVSKFVSKILHGFWLQYNHQTKHYHLFDIYFRHVK